MPNFRLLRQIAIDRSEVNLLLAIIFTKHAPVKYFIVLNISSCRCKSLEDVYTAKVSVESRACSIGRIQQQKHVICGIALTEPRPSSLPPVYTARVPVESRVCSISRI